MAEPKQERERQTLPAGADTGPVLARPRASLTDAELGWFEGVPVGLYRMSFDGTFREVNRELARLLGYPGAEALMVVSARALFFDTGDWDEWRRRIAVDGRVTQVDSRYRRLDGTPVWLRNNARGVRNDEGELLFYEGAVVDVTALHRAEEDLRRSEARFRALVDTIPDAMLRVDWQGICTDARLGRLAGVLPPREEIVGFELEEIFSPELASALRDALERCHQAGTITFETRALGAPSAVFYEVCVSSGGKQDALVLIRDVSDARRMREWIYRNERLASVGSLATGVAHEINNPLTAVVVNADFVQETLLQCEEDAGLLARSADERVSAAGTRIRERLDEAGEALRDVALGAQRVAEVVRELKAFASPADDATGSVNLEEVLEAALRLVNNQIRHRATLNREFAGVPSVWGNATRLEEVFVHLLVNAAQAIQAGSADKNEIRVSAGLAEDGRVVVAIGDTGAGIPPHTLERIFDPFFTTKPVGTGTGTGLAVCQSTVSSYGGEITVQSGAEGSTFRVWLLRTDDVPKCSPTLPLPVSVARRARIAVIDDDALASRALQRLIGGVHDVFLANQADAVLELIDGGARFDLILCDVMMPVTTGVEFHKRLTQMNPELAARVVFLTGGVFAEDTRKYLSTLENPILEKPVDAAQIHQLVVDYTAKKAPSRGGRRNR
jgi:PAS domain S-box-containing protein